MSTLCQVLEYSRAPVVGGVIVGVKVIGCKSRNGRTYPQAVLRAAKPLYENCPVFMFHPSDPEKRKGSRQLADHFGSLVNIRERGEHGNITGLFADLIVKQQHPMAGMVCESDGQNFGLSHNAIVEMNDDKTEVVSIVEVNSVDLVDHPATNQNLFEEEDVREELKELSEAVAGMRTALDGYNERHDKRLVVLEELLEKREAEVKLAEKPKQRVTAFEDVTPEEGDGPKPMGDTHQELLDACRGFRTT